MSSSKETGLVGMYCLTFGDGGKLEHRGQVIGMVETGVYIVQWFEWLLCNPTHSTIVAVESMFDWKFYSSKDDWHEAVENYRELRRIEIERSLFPLPKFSKELENEQ